MKVYVSIIILSCLTIAIGGCTSGVGGESDRFEKQIVQEIDRCPDLTTCRVSINAFTPFEWDTAYVFQQGVAKIDRDKLMGVEDKDYLASHRQIVFLMKGKIVFQESEPSNDEHPVKDQVVFPMNYGYPTYAKISRGSLYSVRRAEETGVGRYFILTPVK